MVIKLTNYSIELNIIDKKVLFSFFTMENFEFVMNYQKIEKFATSSTFLSFLVENTQFKTWLKCIEF